MATGAISLALALAGLLIDTGRKHAEQTAINKQAYSEIQAARRAAAFDIQALQDQIYQAKQSTNLRQFERRRQALRDQSRLLVAAGEAGVGGNSVLRSLANEMWDTSHDTGILQTNLQNQVYQSSQQARAVAANMQSRINSAQARIRNPWIQSALGIATGLPAAFEMKQRIGG